MPGGRRRLILQNLVGFFTALVLLEPFKSAIRLAGFGVICVNGNYKVHNNNRILLTNQIGKWEFNGESSTENVPLEDKEMEFYFADDGTLRFQPITQDGSHIGDELKFFEVPPGGSLRHNCR